MIPAGPYKAWGVSMTPVEHRRILKEIRQTIQDLMRGTIMGRLGQTYLPAPGSYTVDRVRRLGDGGLAFRVTIKAPFLTMPYRRHCRQVFKQPLPRSLGRG